MRKSYNMMQNGKDGLSVLRPFYNYSFTHVEIFFNSEGYFNEI